MSLVVDASAALALALADEAGRCEAMEDRLAAGEDAYTAPKFFQEVMEALRGAIREGRTTSAAAWLTVLDSYAIIPCAHSSLRGIAEVAVGGSVERVGVRRPLHRDREKPGGWNSSVWTL